MFSLKGTFGVQEFIFVDAGRTIGLGVSENLVCSLDTTLEKVMDELTDFGDKVVVNKGIVLRR